MFLCGLAAIFQRRRTGALPTVVNGGDDIATLLLDRRLAMARGRHITSFIAGMIASLLPPLKLFLDSVVLSAVPSPILDVFTSLLSEALPAVRRSKLLFRSSRDGTTAAAFHSRCDERGPTLTLIKDTAGNVFGGYTSLHWNSAGEDGDRWVDRRNDPAAFLFTVVNPHADPPALFSSTADRCSIACASHAGPWFGGGVSGLYVSGAFDGDCFTTIGCSYVNFTRHSGGTVLTGAAYFTPTEVEVWGLADQLTIPCA